CVACLAICFCLDLSLSKKSLAKPTVPGSKTAKFWNLIRETPSAAGQVNLVAARWKWRGTQAWGCHGCRGGDGMLLDTLDQKTVDSLPHLPDVYDAYGVQVNALSVSEIFALYEHTGFLHECLVRWSRRLDSLFRQCSGTRISHYPERYRCRRKSEFASYRTVHRTKKLFWKLPPPRAAAFTS